MLREFFGVKSGAGQRFFWIANRNGSRIFSAASPSPEACRLSSVGGNSHASHLVALSSCRNCFDRSCGSAAPCLCAARRRWSRRRWWRRFPWRRRLRRRRISRWGCIAGRGILGRRVSRRWFLRWRISRWRLQLVWSISRGICVRRRSARVPGWTRQLRWHAWIDGQLGVSRLVVGRARRSQYRSRMALV